MRSPEPSARRVELRREGALDVEPWRVPGNAPRLRPVPRSAPWQDRAGVLAGDLLRAALAALVLYSFLFNLSVVRGNSMAPGIADGDRILVEPWSYVLDSVDRGDIVVLRYPLDPEVDYIKRVVGLPGDELTIAGGRVWVNGQLLDEPYVSHLDEGSYASSRVAAGHYFVLGDNRPRSSDSREFGLVPAALIRGRVDLRLWPLHRLGLID